MGLGVGVSRMVKHDPDGTGPHYHWQREDGSLGRAFRDPANAPPDLRPGERVRRSVPATMSKTPRPQP